MEIIKAGEQHMPGIAELWWEFMKYSENIDPLYTPEEDAIPVFISNYLRPAMEDENSLVLAAAEDGKVVGYSYALIVPGSKLEKRPEYGCIHDMFVTSTGRNKGIGEKILNEVYRWFRLHDIQRVELDVIENNFIADSFWRKRGFTDSKHTLFHNI